MSMSEMYPLIMESIKDGGSFLLCPKGTSMLPTIKPLEDCVTLISPDDLKKYDIVLYKRKNGQFVLHRIVGYKNNFPVMCGDNQTAYEHGIEYSDIIAKVSAIRKNDGRIIDVLDKYNVSYAKKLRAKKAPLRFYRGVKKSLYPFYKAIFKR